MPGVGARAASTASLLGEFIFDKLLLEWKVLSDLSRARSWRSWVDAEMSGVHEEPIWRYYGMAIGGGGDGAVESGLGGRRSIQFATGAGRRDKRTLTRGSFSTCC